MNDKKRTRKEAIIKTIVISSVGVIVAVSLILFISMQNAEQERIEEQMKEHSKAELEIWIYQIEQENIAVRCYDNNYTKDHVIMDAFYSIRSIYPCLFELMKDIREDIISLNDNINQSNFDKAWDTYQICHNLNGDYSENYTIYFDRYKEYEERLDWIDYLSVPYISCDSDRSWDQRFLIVIKSDYDSDHNDGFEVEWFTDELKYYGEQLHYIKQIFEVKV